MPVALLNSNISYPLNAALTATALDLPISAGNISALCQQLTPLNHTYFSISSLAGFEIVKAACVAGVVTLQRGMANTIAIAHPNGACVKPDNANMCAIEDFICSKQPTYARVGTNLVITDSCAKVTTINLGV